jgi:ribonuclease P protein component
MLPASERLRSNREFQQVYKQGVSFAEGQVVLYLLRLPGSEGRQVGFSVSKKLGGAVTRNLVKRRLRECYKALLPQLPPGYQAIVVARRSAASAEYAQLAGSLRGALVRSGLLADMV